MSTRFRNLDSFAYLWARIARRSSHRFLNFSRRGDAHRFRIRAIIILPRRGTPFFLS